MAAAVQPTSPTKNQNQAYQDYKALYLPASETFSETEKKIPLGIHANLPSSSSRYTTSALILLAQSFIDLIISEASRGRGRKEEGERERERGRESPSAQADLLARPIKD